MKLIIDISDHIYSMVTNTGTFGCYRFNTSKAIRQGIPLDKIRAEIEEIEINGHIRDVECFSAGINIALNVIEKYTAESEK